MASYTAAEALDLILGSSKDLESGDESDIEEDPFFPLPRLDDSGDDSEVEQECTDESGEEDGRSEEDEIESHKDAGRLKIFSSIL